MLNKVQNANVCNCRPFEYVLLVSDFLLISDFSYGDIVLKVGNIIHHQKSKCKKTNQISKDTKHFFTTLCICVYLRTAFMMRALQTI